LARWRSIPPDRAGAGAATGRPPGSRGRSSDPAARCWPDALRGSPTRWRPRRRREPRGPSRPPNHPGRSAATPRSNLWSTNPHTIPKHCRAYREGQIRWARTDRPDPCSHARLHGCTRILPARCRCPHSERTSSYPHGRRTPIAPRWANGRPRPGLSKATGRTPSRHSRKRSRRGDRPSAGSPDPYSK